MNDVNYFNGKLKQVTNFKQLKKLMNEAEEESFFLQTKKSGKGAIDFTESFNQNRVDYLMDDGVGVGKCRYENLYKVLKFR